VNLHLPHKSVGTGPFFITGTPRSIITASTSVPLEPSNDGAARLTRATIRTLGRESRRAVGRNAWAVRAIGPGRLARIQWAGSRSSNCLRSRSRIRGSLRAGSKRREYISSIKGSAWS